MTDEPVMIPPKSLHEGQCVYKPMRLELCNLTLTCSPELHICLLSKDDAHTHHVVLSCVARTHSIPYIRFGF